MEKTTAGLPNTCAGCGQEIEGEWYAQNDDVALSGVGFHSLQCAAKHVELSGYVAPTPKQEEEKQPAKKSTTTRKRTPTRKRASSTKKTTE